MKISELQARQGSVELTAQIVSIEAPRSFNKFGKEGKVANAKIKDDSGEVTLTLWNEQCDQVNVGDTVAIHNGWVSEYRGELQLSTGKFGQLEIVAGGASAKVTLASAPITPANAAPKPAHHAPEYKTQTPTLTQPLPKSAQSSLIGSTGEPEFTTADKYEGGDGVGGADDDGDEPFDDSGDDFGGDDFD